MGDETKAVDGWKLLKGVGLGMLFLAVLVAGVVVVSNVIDDWDEEKVDLCVDVATSNLAALHRGQLTPEEVRKDLTTQFDARLTERMIETWAYEVLVGELPRFPGQQVLIRSYCEDWANRKAREEISTEGEEGSSSLPTTPNQPPSVPLEDPYQLQVSSLFERIGQAGYPCEADYVETYQGRGVGSCHLATGEPVRVDVFRNTFERDQYEQEQIDYHNAQVEEFLRQGLDPSGIQSILMLADDSWLMRLNRQDVAIPLQTTHGGCLVNYDGSSLPGYCDSGEEPEEFEEGI